MHASIDARNRHNTAGNLVVNGAPYYARSHESVNKFSNGLLTDATRAQCIGSLRREVAHVGYESVAAYLRMDRVLRVFAA